MRTTAQIRHRFVSSLRLENAQAEVERLSGLAKVEPFRTIRLAILGASRNNDLLWASALTYTSSLSLVPILALAFSALAGLGGTDRIRPLDRALPGGKFARKSRHVDGLRQQHQCEGLGRGRRRDSCW